MYIKKFLLTAFIFCIATINVFAEKNDNKYMHYTPIFLCYNDFNEPTPYHDFPENLNFNDSISKLIITKSLKSTNFESVIEHKSFFFYNKLLEKFKTYSDSIIHTTQISDSTFKTYSLFPDNKYFCSEIIYFNENRKRIQKLAYNDKLNIISTTTYAYTDIGKISKILVYDTNNKLDEIYIFKYEEAVLVEATHYKKEIDPTTMLSNYRLYYKNGKISYIAIKIYNKFLFMENKLTDEIGCSFSYSDINITVTTWNILQKKKDDTKQAETADESFPIVIENPIYLIKKQEYFFDKHNNIEKIVTHTNNLPSSIYFFNTYYKN